MPPTLPSRKRSLRAAGLAVAALGLACLGEAPAVETFTADDLRGTWVVTLTIRSGNQAGAIYYLQTSWGGNASNANATLEVLSGGTLQESPTRTVTGGSMTITPTGFVYGAITLIDPNALTTTLTLNSSSVLVTNPAPASGTNQGTIRRGLQPDKNTIPGDLSGTVGAASNDSKLDTNAAIITGYWSANKISDMEVRDGNNAGQACFLSSARRR